MTGDETIKRATDAYLAGMINAKQLERWIDKGVRAGGREVSWADISLPFPWEIDQAKAARKVADKEINRFLRQLMRR